MFAGFSIANYFVCVHVFVLLLQWDPLGLLKDADQERFDRLRYVETKHGRISMLAILGHLVTTSGYRLPGEIAFGIPFASVPSGLAAANVIPFGGLVQIFFFIGALEIGFGSRQREIEEYCAPIFGTDRRRLAVELNNGRAAMMGILGLMVHEKISDSPYVINELLGYPVPFNQ